MAFGTRLEILPVPGVSFTDAPQARTALGLGSMATQSASAVAITGGTVSGVVFTGSTEVGRIIRDKTDLIER